MSKQRLHSWTKIANLLDMLTQSELAALLKSVPVEPISKLSGVNTKTIYRLRHSDNSPTLKTVEKLVSAVRLYKAGEAAKKEPA